ncbi:MAG: CHASE domain-containing protein [Alphaproteobacteria bacterium]|nr:CHASE domain-containing protein [Alphaproteobacteria bacterium]
MEQDRSRDGARWRRPLRTYRLAWLLAIAGLLASVWVGWTGRRAARDAYTQQLTRHADQRLQAVRSELERELQVVQSLAALFDASPAVKQDEFRAFTRPLLKLNRSLRALEWAPRVPGDQRTAFERAARADGLPGYVVTELGFQGNLTAAAERGSFFPVLYVEPVSGNERIFGLDMASDAQRREALQRAGETGQATATAPLQLAQSRMDRRDGFLVVMPVYGPEQEVQGYALAGYQAQDIVLSALAEFRETEQPVDIQLLDATPGADRRVLFDTRRLDGHRVTASALESELAGRAWEVRALVPEDHASAAGLTQQIVLTLIGLVITSLLVAYALVVLDQKATVEQEVAERTRELGEAKAAAEASARSLEEANALLLKRNRELDEFLFIASHDLQEPVRRLALFSDLLQRSLGDVEGPTTRALGGIQRATARMRQLVTALHQLNQVSRLDARPQAVHIDDCVDSAVEKLADRLAEATLHRPELPCVQGSPALLRQIYLQLIDNALKYNHSEHPQVTLTAEQDEAGWILGVKDDGIGLDEHDTEQIFAPFRRLHTDVAFEGAGIGLTICQKAVERMGGRIWVESRPGHGAHFRFTVPGMREAMPESAAAAS